MSTAGKVLVALILLASLVWMLLTAGVDQINRNGSQALGTLTEKVTKLEADVHNTQQEIVRVRDQVHLYQEQMDRELAVINSRQNDVQRLASVVAENLSRFKYQRDTVNQTAENAKRDLGLRAAEAVADKAALNAALDELKTLQVTDGELRKRLASLRTEFTTTVNSSVKVLQQSVK